MSAASVTDYRSMESVRAHDRRHSFLPAPYTARWVLAQFVSPKAVDAAVAGLSLTLCALLLRGIDVATEAVGLHPLPVFAVPILPSSLLFFAGPVPPPARGFLLCTIFAWAAALGINYVDFHDDFDEPTAAALVVGVLLALFKATNNFFVPAVGLVAALVADPTRGLEDPVAALRFLAAPWLAGHALMYGPHTARRAAGGGCARRSRSRAFKAELATAADAGDDALRAAFARFDTSGDGFLQPGELKYAEGGDGRGHERRRRRRDGAQHRRGWERRDRRRRVYCAGARPSVSVC